MVVNLDTEIEIDFRRNISLFLLSFFLTDDILIATNLMNDLDTYLNFSSFSTETSILLGCWVLKVVVFSYEADYRKLLASTLKLNKNVIR
jgi:hypothetical protein